MRQASALAEQLPNHTQTPDMPEVLAAHEVESYLEAQTRFERWIGSVAVSGPAEKAETLLPKVNLLERMQAAKKGSEEARRSVAANVDTAIYEAVFKEDYVGETYMDVGADGRLTQFGQTNDEIHRNALARPDRHPALKAITEAEAFNRHQIETALQEGLLDTHYYVVFSLVPDGVPEKQLGSEGDGYFLDDLTMSIQATTLSPGGRVKTESAFTAGVEERPGDTFEQRLARRHDFQAVDRLYSWFDKEAPGTAPGLLPAGLFIPKEKMPHGVADVRYWLDVAKDKVLGHDGSQRQIEDYVDLRLKSKRREASLSEVRASVLEDMMAATDELATAMEASDLMWELVRSHATEEAFTNDNIDPKAFGREAAANIMQARHHLRRGNMDAALNHMRIAAEVAEISGCGGGAGRARSARPESSEDLSHIAGEDDKGSLAFRCPDCGRVNVRKRGEMIPNCFYENCGADVSC